MNRTNTVLLVSEMNTINNVLIRTLEKQGFYIVNTKVFEETIKRDIFINLPDILLVDYDIVAINLDNVIKYFKEEYDRKKKIIYMATKLTPEQKRELFEKGVDFIVDKPFNFKYLGHKLNSILNNKDLDDEYNFILNKSLAEKIFELAEQEIFKMGVKPTSKAWNKICDSIALIVENNGNVDNLKKNIYSEIGKKYNTSDEGIDSTLRRCIGIIWKNGDTNYLKHYFDVYSNDEWANLKPSNKRFLKTVSDNVIKKLNKINKYEQILIINNKK